MSDSTAEAARKRRIAMRNQKRSASFTADIENQSIKRSRVSEEVLISSDSSVASTLVADAVASKSKPHITGIKKQSRYDPGVPMTREELKVWRKEARRVRNRESAASSRKKNRERITELESEVDAIKSKYAAALRVIVDLEASLCDSDRVCFTPPTLIMEDFLELRASKPHNGATKAPAVSPPQSPVMESIENHELLSSLPLSFSVEESVDRPSHNLDAVHHLSKILQHQHVIDMISRPIAAKISPGADVVTDHSLMKTGYDGSVDDDRENLMMMKMMNSPDEPIPYHEGLSTDWQSVTEASDRALTECSTSSVSDSASISECPDELRSVTRDFEETDLRDFLMDTFEGVDVTDVMEDVTNLV